MLSGSFRLVVVVVVVIIVVVVVVVVSYYPWCSVSLYRHGCIDSIQRFIPLHDLNKHLKSASLPCLPFLRLILYVHLQLSTIARNSLFSSTQSLPSSSLTQLISLQPLEMIRAQRRLVPQPLAATYPSFLPRFPTLHDQILHFVQRERLQHQFL